MAKNNTLVVGFKETKDVLMLVIALGRAYEAAKADGKVDWTDLQHLLPVLFLVGPALDGFENVQLELKMATKEEGEELKQWVNNEVNLQDKTVEEFVEASFAIVLDIWMVFRTFFFPGDRSMFKTPVTPTTTEGPTASDIGESDAEVATGSIGEETKIENATPSSE